LIQQELSAAQQRAQANQKSVNATSSESMQILQAVSALLSSLVDLTIKANLTTSPSD
ncbi:CT847 family type III secretion system effector, partial [Chlamydia suis]